MVASVHTAINFIPELLEQDFDLVVVDEAHHVVMATYNELLTALGFLSPPVLRGLAQLSTNLDQSLPELGLEVEDVSSDSSSSSIKQRSITPSSSSSSSSSGVESAKLDAGDTAAVSRGPRNPNKLLMGFTATPYRRRPRDSRLLLEMLEPVYLRDIRTMVKEGYLCPVCACMLSLEGNVLTGCLAEEISNFQIQQCN